MVVSFLSFKKVLASTPLGHIWRVHNHVKPYLPISNRYLKTAAQLRNDDFCPRNIYFDYERPDGLHNTNWLQLTGKYCSTKFIPVTRKVLLKKILEDESIIDNEEFDAFQKLSTGLDSALTAHYKHILKEMKVSKCHSPALIPMLTLFCVRYKAFTCQLDCTEIYKSYIFVLFTVMIIFSLSGTELILQKSWVLRTKRISQERDSLAEFTLRLKA